MAIGALVVVALGIPYLFPDRPVHIAQLASPDGSMEAVAATRAGGWVAASYCQVSIYIAPITAHTRALSTAEFEVFEGDCVTLQDFHKQVAWVSNQNLRISLPTLTGVMTFRARDKTGQVRIDFVVGS